MNKFSKVGFILAAAGSAVGLGNIWRFPYIAGEYGGGAFILIYLLFVLFVGLVVFLAETIIGQYTQCDVATSFSKMAKSKNKNWIWGGIILLTPTIILAFYSVVIGWVINYFLLSFSSLPTDTATAGEIFTNLVTNDITSVIIYHTIVSFLVILIVYKGIIAGIEKANLVLMPLLAIILMILLAYSLTLDSFPKAFTYMFNADFSKITPEALLAALGQAFFTLSLGIGIIMTYSASLPEDNNIVKSTFFIGIIDTLIAIIAGLIIFSFLFEAGAHSSQGPGLVFISLPVIFAKWGIIGKILSALFFMALTFAGITSAISLIEPSLKFLTEKFNFARSKAILLSGFVFYTLGIVAILSMSNDFSEYLTLFGKSAFDLMDYTTSSILMPLGALLVCIFLGYFVDKEIVKNVFYQHSHTKVFHLWFFLLRVVAPLCIIIIFLNKLGFL